ncbi:oligosaccharide flippase family protein [Candidatus Sumerlaeota bacterium]|nr:oligosaccharide flippase family protein [Candidatus Sumerlaeota bacterium]
MAAAIMSAAFSATRWILAGSFGFRLLGYVGQAIILHLLAKEKEVWGAYGSLVDIHMMLIPFLPLALDQVLVREKKREKRYAAALSIMLALIGGFLCLLVGASLLIPSPGAASIAGAAIEKGTTWHAVLFMIPIFIVMATKLSARSILTAELDFKTISIGEFGNGLITYFGGALAIFTLGKSAWALMAAYLAGEVFECAYVFRKVPFRMVAVLAPRRWGILKRIYMKHRKFCLATTADLTLSNVGSLIPVPMIFALIGGAAAADFRVARLLIQMPVLLLVGSVGRVAYPTFVGTTEEVLQSRGLKIVGTTAAFLAPVVIWLAAFGPATAMILAGKDYLSAAPLIAWMGIYMIACAIYSPISSLDMVRNKPEVGLYWTLAHTVARVAVIKAFAPQGVVAVVAAMSVASCVLWIVWAWLLGWLLQAPMTRYWWAALKFAPLWIALAAVFWWLRHLPAMHPVYPALLSGLPVAVYTFIIWKFFPDEWEMLLRLSGRKRKSAA